MAYLDIQKRLSRNHLPWRIDPILFLVFFLTACGDIPRRPSDGLAETVVSRSLSDFGEVCLRYMPDYARMSAVWRRISDQNPNYLRTVDGDSYRTFVELEHQYSIDVFRDHPSMETPEIGTVCRSSVYNISPALVETRVRALFEQRQLSLVPIQVEEDCIKLCGRYGPNNQKAWRLVGLSQPYDLYINFDPRLFSNATYVSLWETRYR